MKIFGIGLSRTGTQSLTKALNVLGYNAIHWYDTKTIIKYLDKKQLSIDFNKLEQYDAFTDIPIARIYKELDVCYPNSKFILTVRDMDSWLSSCRNHFKYLEVLLPNKTAKALHLDLYGTVHFRKKKFKEAYTRHLKDVLNYFKGRERDLLVIDICGGEGWEKLCPFLNKPLPNQAFPKWHPFYNRNKFLINGALSKRKNVCIAIRNYISHSIGIFGIFLKKHYPKLYFKLKNIAK